MKCEFADHVFTLGKMEVVFVKSGAIGTISNFSNPHTKSRPV
jgi:hypothetical protein